MSNIKELIDNTELFKTELLYNYKDTDDLVDYVTQNCELREYGCPNLLDNFKSAVLFDCVRDLYEKTGIGATTILVANNIDAEKLTVPLVCDIKNNDKLMKNTFIIPYAFGGMLLKGNIYGRFIDGRLE